MRKVERVETRFCLKCNANHELMYLVAEDENTHMITKCPIEGVKFWPVVPGLKLKVEHSRRWYRKQRDEQQGTLL